MTDSAERTELVGIGGWLAVFVFILAVISPARSLIETWVNLYGDPTIASALGDSWGNMQLAAWAISFSGVLVTLFLAWRMIKVRIWSTIRMVIAGLWLLSILLPAIDFAIVSWILAIPLSSLLPEITPLVRPIVFSAIWTAYLLSSKRVRNTYPRVPDQGEMAEVFS